MTAKASGPTALPLRVPPELREQLDALTLKVPSGLALPRNSVAIAALLVGVKELSKGLDGDPVAVHRALAEVSADAPRVPSRGAGARRGDEGARAPAPAPRAPRAAAPKRPAPARAAQVAAPSSPDAPDAATVRELLTLVLQRDAAVASGSQGWTVKALARAVGCDRRALQVFRDRGEGMGPGLQAKLWAVLRGDAPVKG